MVCYEERIRRMIREKHWEEKVDFSCSAERLCYHDSRYGAPMTTLEKKDGIFVLESRRDAQRGVLIRQEYRREEEAVEAFLTLMDDDFR